MDTKEYHWRIFMFDNEDNMITVIYSNLSPAMCALGHNTTNIGLTKYYNKNLWGCLENPQALCSHIAGKFNTLRSMWNLKGLILIVIPPQWYFIVDDSGYCLHQRLYRYHIYRYHYRSRSRFLSVKYKPR